MLGNIEEDLTIGQQSNGNATVQSNFSSNIPGMSNMAGASSFNAYPTPSDMTPGYTSTSESPFGDIAVTYNSNTDMRLYAPDPTNTTSNSKFISTTGTYGTGRSAVANMAKIIALQNSALSSIQAFSCTYGGTEPTTADTGSPVQTMPLSYTAPSSSRACTAGRLRKLTLYTLTIMVIGGGLLAQVCGSGKYCHTYTTLLGVIGGVAAIFGTAILIVSGWSLMGDVINKAASASGTSAGLKAAIMTAAKNNIQAFMTLLIEALRDAGMNAEEVLQGAATAAASGGSVDPDIETATPPLQIQSMTA